MGLPDGDPSTFSTRTVLTRVLKDIFDFILCNSMAVDMWFPSFRINILYTSGYRLPTTENRARVSILFFCVLFGKSTATRRLRRFFFASWSGDRDMERAA